MLLILWRFKWIKNKRIRNFAHTTSYYTFGYKMSYIMLLETMTWLEFNLIKFGAIWSLEKFFFVFLFLISIPIYSNWLCCNCFVFAMWLLFLLKLQIFVNWSQITQTCRTQTQKMHGLRSTKNSFRWTKSMEQFIKRQNRLWQIEEQFVLFAPKMIQDFCIQLILKLLRCSHYIEELQYE